MQIGGKAFLESDLDWIRDRIERVLPASKGRQKKTIAIPARRVGGMMRATLIRRPDSARACNFLLRRPGFGYFSATR
jgi:hypothetical protein